MSRPETLIHPSAGIARNVIAVLDDLDRLLARPEQSGKHIHHVRVDIKRLRAWVRLVRTHSDQQEWKYIDRQLRHVARLFSAMRDADVIPATLLWLKKTSGGETAAAINNIYPHLLAASGRMPERENTGMPEAGFHDLLERKIMSAARYEIIRHGMQRTYKRSRALGRKACADKGSVADLHRFRRWVKYLCYQLEFVEDCYDGDYGKIHQQLDKLGKRLGRIHDLVLLRNRLQRLPGTGQYKNDVRVVTKAVHRKLDKLIRKVKRSSGRILAMKPREFAGGLRRF
jgi:CHAD domain-containing protein